MKLQTRLLALFGFLFAIALGIRLFFTWQYQSEQIEEINADIHNVIKVVHFATQRLSSPKERDKEALTRFIKDAVEQYSALKEISIININQEIVASSNQTKVGKKQLEEWKETLIEGEIHDEGSVDWYEVVIPIVKDQKIIGQVKASVALSDATAYLGQMYKKNVIITLVLFIAISFASYIAIRTMVKPLRHLVIAARSVASGDLDVKIPTNGTDEYAEVATAFNTMTEALMKKKDIEDRLKDLEYRAVLSETSATMAHEIRNPLNLINLTAGHLSSQFLPEKEQRREAYLKLIDNLKAQVKHLNNMVNDYLAIGKPIKLKKDHFSLYTLIQQTEMLIMQRLTAKKLTIINDTPEDLCIYGDKEQIRLVLLNLILNAIDLSPDKSVILITAKKDNNFFHITVQDEGPGIPPEDFDKIFEPYYAKRPGGTGLGLTLARRIVEEHNGSIYAINNPIKGACFNIIIPDKGNEKNGTNTHS